MDDSLTFPKYISSKTQSVSPPVRIVLIYLLIGGLWITLSDQIIVMVTDDVDYLSFLQTIKGWFFIAWTAGFLHTLIQRDFSLIQESRQELNNSYEVTLEGWVQALEMRDRETTGHTQRVTEMTLRLASSMGIRETDLEHIRRGAMLHDIGKMGVPDKILFKPASLTDEEWRVMRKHPQYARDFLSKIKHLSASLDIPYYHHERWDGAGYPCGLKGEQIPISARIFTVVDVWDALRSDRPYRKAWPEDKVLSYIQSERGSHFDPRIVDLFMQMVDGNTPARMNLN